MTRYEQAKKDCAIVVSDDMEHGTPFASGYNKGIEAGMEWADSHPNWCKYSDEKPKIEDQYLIITIDKSYIVADYRNSHFVIDLFGICEELQDRDVVAWMENPEPPKFD